MDVEKIDMFIMLNRKFFERNHIDLIRDRLISVDNSKWDMLLAAEFNDPTTVLIVSVFAGNLGIDRFMIGDIVIGFGKLLTYICFGIWTIFDLIMIGDIGLGIGGFGIWTIIDWFMIQKATREKNMKEFQQFFIDDIQQE